MQEEWRGIVGFPGYSVSNTGRVYNDAADRELTLHINQRGIVNVSLSRDRVRHKRSVTVLVATAFIPTARSQKFDTPINLDGDRENNCADNILWRPRWYATEYYRQFREEPQGFDKPVMEVKTHQVFETSWLAAVTFGLLEREIVRSVIERTYAWPTYQMFRTHL